jgi:hypothetical protein
MNHVELPTHASLGFLSLNNDSSDRYHRSEFYVRFLLVSHEMVDGGWWMVVTHTQAVTKYATAAEFYR